MLPETTVLSSITIPKRTQDGRRQIGALTIEVKVCRGYKFVQLTQEKYPSRTQLGKIQCVTLDLMNPKVKEEIIKAFEH